MIKRVGRRLVPKPIRLRIRQVHNHLLSERGRQHFYEDGIEIMHQHYGYSQFSLLLRSHIPVGARVLDIGCNKGLETKIIAERNQVVGIDLFRDFVNAARKRGVDARVMDFHHITFSNEFDCGYCNNSLEHAKYPDRLIMGVHRALRPGGLFIIGLPLDGNNPSVRDPSHHFRAKKEDVLTLLKSNFNIVKLEEIDTKQRWDWEIPPANNKMLLVVAWAVK